MKNKNMFKFKTLLVEKNIECPSCEHHLSLGDIMYFDYKDKIICGYCKSNYIIKNRIYEETCNNSKNS